MLTQATTADLDRLEALYRDSLGLPGCTWTEDYPTREDAAADIARGDLWVLRDEQGRVIAGLSLEEDEVRPFDFCPDKTSPSTELSRVVVAREHQGRGLALLMLGELADILRDRGIRVLRLLVSRGNKPAMATYMRAGFVPLGECDLYGVHWLACEKRL